MSADAVWASNCSDPGVGLKSSLPFLLYPCEKSNIYGHTPSNLGAHCSGGVDMMGACVEEEIRINSNHFVT